MACGFVADPLREVLGEGEARWPAPPLRRGAGAARHRGLRSSSPRSSSTTASWRSTATCSPTSTSAALSRATTSAARGDARALPGRGPDPYGLVRARDGPVPGAAPRGRRDPRVPREAGPGRDRHRRDQRRRLRARAHGARPDPAGPRGLDRARGVPAAGRPRPLRSPARGLLDGHRHPGALPAGELGHPRAPRARPTPARGSTTHGLLVEDGVQRRSRRRGRAAGAARAPRSRSAPAPTIGPARVLGRGCEIGERATRLRARCSCATARRRRRQVRGSILRPGVEVGEGARSSPAR